MTEIIFEPERPDAGVSLTQMLSAREQRALHQKELLSKFHSPLISFTMNIAGPIKQSKAIARAFELCCEAIEEVLAGNRMKLLYRQKLALPTGSQAFYSVDTNPHELKKLCVWIEDSHPLGRLFDIDVIDRGGAPLSRTAIGAGERACMICGKAGHGCAAARAHSVEELQDRTGRMLYEYFLKRDAAYVMSLAAKSLRFEAWTTPKPGLVDLNNNGSHRDMDICTMMRSVSAIAEYFREFFILGVCTAHEPPNNTFLRLRQAGKKAEDAMLEATGGVNTHKGAIFLLGIVCGACGRCWAPSGVCRDVHKIFRTCVDMTRQVLQAELDSLSRETASTFGEKLYVEYGIKGARGQAMDGFPEVEAIALPILKRYTAGGKSLMEAGSAALLYLIANVSDTNIIHRSSLEIQKQAARRVSDVLQSAPFPDAETIRELDREFTEKGLSPGGCADLLAISYFAFFLESREAEADLFEPRKAKEHF